MNQLSPFASIADRFEEFHRANPAVYSTLVALARQWASKTGNRKLGMKTLYERTRWEISLDTSDPNFKLNNNFTAFYSRLIMEQEPDLAGMFDCRCSTADDWINDYLGKTA
jgi:hypothetical protein